jgi:sarcosine oxidase subunit gamma
MSALTEVSQSFRFGLKGPRSLAWLTERGVAPPSSANSWSSLDADDELASGIVMRLGSSEFFIADAHGSERCRALARELTQPIAGVYPVLREDRALELRGPHADAVLAETCNVNFAALQPGARQVVMTMMIGVAVVVVPQGISRANETAHRRYRIWCDPTFGDYLEATLASVLAGIEADAESFK